jgi:hypothetical protein
MYLIIQWLQLHFCILCISLHLGCDPHVCKNSGKKEKNASIPINQMYGIEPYIVLFGIFFSGTPASNRRELCLHLNVVPTGAGVFKSRHILLHKYVNRIMITYLWCQIQLIIPSHHFRSIECRHWPLRDSEAGNIRKQLWLRIPKGITGRQDTVVLVGCICSVKKNSDID